MIVCDHDFPDELLYLIEHQMWARFEPDGRVRVGVTALGATQAGDFYMCRPKRVGTEVERGSGMAVAELSKTVVSIKSPVSGVIDEINTRLEDDPALINRDPYGEGWLACIRPVDALHAREGLESGEAIIASVQEQVRLQREAEKRH